MIKKNMSGIINGLKTRFTSEASKKKWSDPEYKKRVSEKISKALKGKPKSEKHKKKLRGKRPNTQGKNNPNWKGGNREDRLHGKLCEYQEWRIKIFKRDNYTCIMCQTRGGKLNSHHIKKYSKYKELRYELNNGITLCVKCHNKTKHKEERYEKEFLCKLGEAQ